VATEEAVEEEHALVGEWAQRDWRQAFFSLVHIAFPFNTPPPFALAVHPPPSENGVVGCETWCETWKAQLDQRMR